MPVTPDDAVRNYLVWLDDPAKLVDQDKLREAEAAVASATDPLAKLHALADLEHAREADGDQVEQAFVDHAKAYADAEGIPVSAFQQLGVGDDVLARAGFEVGRPRRSGGRRSSGSGHRAPRVPIEQIKAAVHELPKQFTLNDLAEKAGGGSPATLRKAVDELVAAGKVARLGPKEGYTGRGRAPIVWELR